MGFLSSYSSANDQIVYYVQAHKMVEIISCTYVFDYFLMLQDKHQTIAVGNYPRLSLGLMSKLFYYILLFINMMPLVKPIRSFF